MHHWCQIAEFIAGSLNGDYPGENCAKQTRFFTRNLIKLEELKVSIRLCKELQAFPIFNLFQFSVNEVISINRQIEGWIVIVFTNNQNQLL